MQGSSPHLLRCRLILYRLRPQGSPDVLLAEPGGLAGLPPPVAVSVCSCAPLVSQVTPSGPFLGTVFSHWTLSSVYFFNKGRPVIKPGTIILRSGRHTGKGCA